MTNKDSQEIYNEVEEVFKANQGKYITAQEQTAALNAQSQAAYEAQKIEAARAQNQFTQNQAQTQMAALDAIRRSNANAIANGANAGLSAANELSAILGLQEESSQAATDMANANLENAAAYAEQLNANAVKGQEQANQYNATLDANQAELAKTLGVLAGNVSNEKVANMNLEAQKYASDKATEGQKYAADKTVEAAATQSGDTGLQMVDQYVWDEATQSFVKTDKQIAQSLLDRQALLKNWTDHLANIEFSSPEYESTANRLKTQLIKAYNTNDQYSIAKVERELANFLANDAIYYKEEESSCLLPGTKVLLADNTTKNIEDIVTGDVVLAWDMFHGEFTAAPVLFNDPEPVMKRTILNLIFSDNTRISVIGEHGFFDATLRKFIYVNSANVEDAVQYVGHTFLKHSNSKHIKVKLVHVADHTDTTACYDIVTARHLNFYSNNFLGIAGNTSAFTNIFKTNRKCIYSKKDIHKLTKLYGLSHYNDFKNLLPNATLFYYFQGEYLKIKLEKGEIKMSDLTNLAKHYEDYLK